MFAQVLLHDLQQVAEANESAVRYAHFAVQVASSVAGGLESLLGYMNMSVGRVLTALPAAADKLHEVGTSLAAAGLASVGVACVMAGSCVCMQRRLCVTQAEVPPLLL